MFEASLYVIVRKFLLYSALALVLLFFLVTRAFPGHNGVSPMPAADKELEFEHLGSGRSVNVSFFELESGVEVTVLLSDSEEDTVYSAAIYEGVCENRGELLHQLSTLEDGFSATALNTSLADIKSGQKVVVLEQMSASSATRTACTEL